VADRVREARLLQIISVGLILFELAGGTLQGLSVGGGLIQLKDPAIVLYFAWAALAYVLWRYWQCTQGQIGGTIMSDYYPTLAALPAYQNLVKQYEGVVEGERVGNPSPIIVRTWFSRALDYRRRLQTGGALEANLQHNPSKVKVPYWRCVRAEIRAWAIIIFKHQAFADLVGPYIFAGAAIAITIYKHASCWQRW
jgi:hypothetical protein